MITKLQVYGPLSATELDMSEAGIEDDLIQITNIDGLDPVKASISLTDLALIDGATLTGSHIPSRNIVLTIRPNPDWSSWLPDTLRQLIFSYFMPKLGVRLVFTSDEVGEVKIDGIVESVVANPFTKDPEFIVSIICPDPFFEATEVVELDGSSIALEDFEDLYNTITYDGNVPVGFTVEVYYASGDSPEQIGIQSGQPEITSFWVHANVLSNFSFQMSSIPKRKYAQNVSTDTGQITNMLAGVRIGSKWPLLMPGENKFAVLKDAGIQTWILRYYNKFGGI